MHPSAARGKVTSYHTLKHAKMADPKSYLSQNTDPLSIYVKEHSFRKVEALERLQEETKKLGKKYKMLVDPLEAQFLRFLLKASGAKRLV